MTSLTDPAGSAQQQAHLTAVIVTCPSGHGTSTQARGGTRIKCGRCAEAGTTTLVLVPLRPGEQPPKAVTCRTCGREGDTSLPPGWVSLVVGADPARTRAGKPWLRVGPYCSAPCAAAALHGARGVNPGRRPPGPSEAAMIIAKPPRGR